MDSQHLTRVINFQKLAMFETTNKIGTLHQFIDDYKALKNLLETLPEFVKHKVKIPLGSMAFMAGLLCHTNELLVLLGDNWFSERSVKQSIDIVMRRIKDLEETVEVFEKQKNFIEPRVAFSQDLHDIAQNENIHEIKEEYDEEKDNKWKEHHRQNLQKFRKELIALKSNCDNNIEDECETQRLWQHLEELENEEICNLSSDEHQGVRGSLYYGVSVGPDENGETLLNSSRDGEDDDRKFSSLTLDSMSYKSVSTITFHHSISAPKVEFSARDSTIEQKIMTPADINRNCHTVPRSMLKVSVVPGQLFETENLEPGCHSQTVDSNPVSSVIHERNVGLSLVSNEEKRILHSLPIDVEPKQVSMFKASKLKPLNSTSLP